MLSDAERATLGDWSSPGWQGSRQGRNRLPAGVHELIDHYARVLDWSLKKARGVGRRGQGRQIGARGTGDTAIAPPQIVSTAQPQGVEDIGSILRRATRFRGRGVHMGRPPKLTPHQQAEARGRRDNGEALTDIARTYGVAHTTIARL
jgi:hypothetical protein